MAEAWCQGKTLALKSPDASEAGLPSPISHPSPDPIAAHWSLWEGSGENQRACRCSLRNSTGVSTYVPRSSSWPPSRVCLEPQVWLPLPHQGTKSGGKRVLLNFNLAGGQVELCRSPAGEMKAWTLRCTLAGALGALVVSSWCSICSQRQGDGGRNLGWRKGGVSSCPRGPFS